MKIEYAYTYDANGNQLTVGSDTYIYNVLNQLTNAKGTNYNYLPNGLRYSRMAMREVYNNGNLVYEYKGTETEGKEVSYLYGLEILKRTTTDYHTEAGWEIDWWNYTGMESAPPMIWVEKRVDVVTAESYGTNGQGDVTWCGNNNISGSYTYDAFGNLTSQTGTSQNPILYRGQYKDAATGDYYLRARNYTSRTGRFTGEDPAYDGTNWYVYCGNNPVMYVDPTGKIKESDKKFGENSAVYRALVVLGNAWEGLKDYRADIEKLAEYIRNGAALLSSALIDGIINAGHNTGLMPTNLNVVEQVLSAINPTDAISVGFAREAADTVTQNMFGEEGNGDGNSNAFKHALWSGLAAYAVGGEMAKLFTDAHEFGWYEAGDDPLPYQMDIHNNSVGLAIGMSERRWGSQARIENRITVTLRSGGLKRIKNGRLINTGR